MDPEMSTQKLIFGLALGMALDIGTGLIMKVLVAWGHPVPPIWYYHLWYYFWGVFFLLLPDFDKFIPIILKFAFGIEFDSSQKALPTHYPLVTICPATLVVVTQNMWVGCGCIFMVSIYFWFWQTHKGLELLNLLIMWGTILAPTLVIMITKDHFIAMLVIFGLAAHYLHDSWQSQERGPGVRWLAPFSDTYYQIFSREYTRGKFYWWFFKVSPERVEKAFKETLEEWLNAIFFKRVPMKIWKFEFDFWLWENIFGVTLAVIGVLRFAFDIISTL